MRGVGGGEPFASGSGPQNRQFYIWTLPSAMPDTGFAAEKVSLAFAQYEANTLELARVRS